MSYDSGGRWIWSFDDRKLTMRLNPEMSVYIFRRSVKTTDEER